MSRLVLARRLTIVGYFGLLLLLPVWQLWLAPGRLPAWLVLTVLVGPLLPVLPGIIAGRPKSHFWASVLALLYLLHGCGEAFAVPGERLPASLEIILSIVLYAGGLLYVRARGGVIPRAQRGG